MPLLRPQTPPGLNLFAKLLKKLLNLSLYSKIIGMVLGLTCLIGVVTIYKFHQVLTEDAARFLEAESRSLAAEFAESSREYLLINDLYGLTRDLKFQAQSRPDLRYAVVLDDRGRVLAHTFQGGFPPDLLRHIQGDLGHKLRTVQLLSTEGVIWESRHPIRQGEEGTVWVGLGEQRLHTRTGILIRALLLTILVMVGLSIVCSAFLTWLITKPVNSLLQATRKVRQGDYTVTVAPYANDEVGGLIEAFNEMVAQLREAERERIEKEKMRSDFLQSIISTQENERKRIARELHDQTGQALASFMVAIKMLENSSDRNQGNQELIGLKAAITKEMESIHDLALELRPPVLDHLGLIPALELYLKEYKSRHGLMVEFVAIGFEHSRPDPCVETCIYRLIQEALTNVIRHARADTVNIILEWCPEKIRGIVEDNGIGFERKTPTTPSGRLGLYGMEERVLLLAGSFRIESEPGQGAMVIFDIPVPAKATQEESVDD